MRLLTSASFDFPFSQPFYEIIIEEMAKVANRLNKFSRKHSFDWILISRFFFTLAPKLSYGMFT